MIFVLAALIGVVIAAASHLIGTEADTEKASKRGHIFTIVVASIFMLLIMKELTVINAVATMTISFLSEMLYKYIQFQLLQKK